MVDKFNSKYKLNEEDYTSEEFLMIAFSFLEMKGYTGLLQLFSILEKPQELIKVIRLMSGMQFKIPSLTEFSEAITLCIFFFLYATKELNEHKGISEVLNITSEQTADYIKQFDKWCEYLKQNGYQLSNFVKFRSKKASLYKKLKNNGW